MAEGLFRKLVKDEESVEVLGSAGVSAYPGDLISPDTAKILKSEGAELPEFRSRAVDDALLSEATHVFAMTESHLDMLTDAFPAHEEKCHLVCDFIEFDGKVGVDVPDPIGQGKSAYEFVADVFGHALPTLLMFMQQTDEDTDLEDSEDAE